MSAYHIASRNSNLAIWVVFALFMTPILIAGLALGLGMVSTITRAPAITPTVTPVTSVVNFKAAPQPTQTPAPICDINGLANVDGDVTIWMGAYHYKFTDGAWESAQAAGEYVWPVAGQFEVITIPAARGDRDMILDHGTDMFLPPPPCF